MKRLLFSALAGSVGIVAAAACDPDLTPTKTPGEPATEGGADGGPVATADGGPTEGGDGADGSADSGFAHKIDGVNDFTAGEKLQTSSSSTNYFAYAAWDATNLYFGMEGPDVSSGTPNAGNKWVMVYLGRDALPGSTDGLPYNGTVQQPNLPFSASIHLRWKVSGSYSNVNQWNAGSGQWADAPLIPLTVVRQGTFVEMGVSRAALGSPTKIQIVMNMLIENGGDFTYAGVPSTTFGGGGDRTDPDFTKYYEFDLSNLAVAPNGYAPLP